MTNRETRESRGVFRQAAACMVSALALCALVGLATGAARAQGKARSRDEARGGGHWSTNQRQTTIEFAPHVTVEPEDGDSGAGMRRTAPGTEPQPLPPETWGGRRAYPVLPRVAPPDMEGTVLIEGEPGRRFLAIQVSTNEISFEQEAERPGLLQGQPLVHVVATSDASTWVVNCQASPLMTADGAAIPPERCFVRSSWTRTAADEGGGPGFVQLGAPRAVAARQSVGDPPVASVDLDFRLLTTWQDRPGVYQGQIEFLYIIRP